MRYFIETEMAGEDINTQFISAVLNYLPTPMYRTTSVFNDNDIGVFVETFMPEGAYTDTEEDAIRLHSFVEAATGQRFIKEVYNSNEKTYIALFGKVDALSSGGDGEAVQAEAKSDNLEPSL